MQSFSPILFSIFGIFHFVRLFKSLRTASLHVYSLYIVGIVVRSPGDPLHWLLTAINQSLPTRIELFLKWTMIFGVILLMEEILHQLIGCLSHYLQGFIHPRWCRISSMESITRTCDKVNKTSYLHTLIAFKTVCCTPKNQTEKHPCMCI